jgi:MFS family permease
VRRNVREPELWLRNRAQTGPRVPWRDLSRLLAPPLRRVTIAVTVMNACTMFAWWGFNLWIPAYLSLPTSQGGIGLSTSAMSSLVIVMQLGMWLGYVSFGFISDAIGRKRSYVVYVLVAAVLMLAYSVTTRPALLLVLGPVTAFFATGYFSGFGAVTAEIFETTIRATAQGLTYNFGRLASAVAPMAVGSLAAAQGFDMAFAVAASAFVLAAACWIWIPETRGRALV